jgi:starvation-inducible DNA-binding protein
MVQSVISDFEKLSEEFLEIIEVAEQEDPVTADMLTGMKKSLNKHAWMLRAYLGH